MENQEQQVNPIQTPPQMPPQVPPMSNGSGKKVWPWVLVGVLVVAILVGGAFWFGSRMGGDKEEVAAPIVPVNDAAPVVPVAPVAQTPAEPAKQPYNVFDQTERVPFPTSGLNREVDLVMFPIFAKLFGEAKLFKVQSKDLDYMVKNIPGEDDYNLLLEALKEKGYGIDHYKNDKNTKGNSQFEISTNRMYYNDEKGKNSYYLYIFNYQSNSQQIHVNIRQ